MTSCRKTPPPAVEEGPSRLGKPVSAYGERSPLEKPARAPRSSTKTQEAASSTTPLQEQTGILTPSSLHFERHHAGVPQIHPERHRLLIHGMVDRPLAFTMEEIRRLPSISRILFIECAGNGGAEWGPKPAPDAQRSHGLASCSEWTGVPLKLLLEEAGIQPRATWLLAEGADACRMQRSIPAGAAESILIAYGQNGEALRPEQGYPLRLVAPGWEGNVCVKWLHRIKAFDRPHMTKDETSKYTDLMPDGTARQFTFLLDAKSVITRPSGGQKVAAPGFHEITGLAWSGRGRIERVEVSTDGGRNWRNAVLDEPRLPQAFTRFHMPWTWGGRETILLSRATDQTGYVQPAREELVAVRGLNSLYHNNAVKAWRIAADGSVTHVEG